MFDHWMPISDIPAEGKTFVFDEQEPWREAWKAFGLELAPVRDIVAEATVLPQSDDAALVRGSIKGAVSMPCDRCTEPFELDIDLTFDAYERLPGEEDDEEPRVRLENGQLQLNIGATLWEEFALALPVKPLCDEGCKGVCPSCGADLNKGDCNCDRDEGDERLAVFRNLKIK